MPNKTIDMFKIRQLLRFYADGRGSKFISRATGISRNTVKKYLIQFTTLQLTIEQVEAMSDRQMATAFLIEKPKVTSSRLGNLESVLPGLADKMAPVSKSGYITLDHRYYSIPYKFIGTKIKLMYNRSKVEAYNNHDLIAVHTRHYDKEKYIENKEHLASWLNYPADRNSEKFIADATPVDPAVVAYIKKVLSRSEYPEKNYRACLGILNYKSRVGTTRLINACKRADSFNVYNFGIIERILKSKADFIPLDDEDPCGTNDNNMPDHDNIRGEDYYD